MNNVTLVGRLTKDVEMRYVPNSGTAVANFTIAVDRDFVRQDGTRETDFIDIQVWQKQAETCEKYLAKGHMVGVTGAIRIDSYTDAQGVRRRSFKINANRIQFLTPKNGNGATKPVTEEIPMFNPNFDAPPGLDPNGFQAINDEEIPF